MIVKEKFFNNKYFKIIVCTLITGYVFFPDSKNKTNLKTVDGIVVSLKNSIEHHEGKDSFNYRFLKITNYEKPFEIYLGKSRYDFKPDLQKVDQLKVGDTISVYYRERILSSSGPTNINCYFIYRNEEEIYIMGNSSDLKIFGLLVFTILLCSLVIYLCIRFGKKTYTFTGFHL